MVKISKIGISSRQAAEATMEKLSKKKVFGLIKPLDIEDINIEDIKIFYVPFYVAMTENVIKSKLFRDNMYHLLFAVEGYTGESGITVGIPQFIEEEIENIGPVKFVKPKVNVEEAKAKIVDCATNYVVRKNRRIPETKVTFMDIIWKPTYMIPVAYKEKGIAKTMRRFVDAESGYNVYRYDLIWEKMLLDIA